MSVFLGEQLGHILDQIERGELAGSAERKHLDLGLAKLPMLGTPRIATARAGLPSPATSSSSARSGAGRTIAVPLCVINTVVGDAATG